MRGAIASILVFTLALTIAFLAGCGSEARSGAPAGDPPKPGSYAQGGLATPYYGEELFEGRIYLFGSKKAHEDFKASHVANPLASKTFIKSGPNRETVVVQTDKEQPTQADRLWTQFRARYRLA